MSRSKVSYEHIDLIISEGVARITLSRPHRLNAFTASMHREIDEALTSIERATDVRAVMLTGAGRAFCAGQDLSERRSGQDTASIDLGESIERFYNPLVRRLATMPLPVVCAVNGVAAGAGVNIALACDIVVAARSARFIQSFAALGLIPDSGGTWVLPRLVGRARALGLALLGDPIDAETAAAWGLIWQVVDDDQLMDVASNLAERLAKGAPEGLAATKQLVRASTTLTLDEALDIERDEMRRLGNSLDYREGVEAFLAKRPPVFRGR